LGWEDFSWDRVEKYRAPLTIVQTMDEENAVRIRAEEGTEDVEQRDEDPRLK
jgi:hypothetical protein